MLNPGSISAILLIGASAMYCLVLFTFARARRRLPLWWFAFSCLMMGLYSVAMVLVATPGIATSLVLWAGPVGYATASFFVASSSRYARHRIGSGVSPLELATESGLLIAGIASLVPGLVSPNWYVV